MQPDRPVLSRGYSTNQVPQAYASTASTEVTSFGSPSPSSPGMASSSSESSPTQTSPRTRLRRANAPIHIAMPTSPSSSPTTRNRARSDALNTPLAFNAMGTVVFGIRTPTFEARTPSLESPDAAGRPAHRVELAALNRVASNEARPVAMPPPSYFDNVNIYGPIKCRMPTNRFTTHDREMFWSLDLDNNVPPAMSRDVSPSVTPFTPETPRDRL